MEKRRAVGGTLRGNDEQRKAGATPEQHVREEWKAEQEGREDHQRGRRRDRLNRGKEIRAAAEKLHQRPDGGGIRRETEEAPGQTAAREGRVEQVMGNEAPPLRDQLLKGNQMAPCFSAADSACPRPAPPALRAGLLLRKPKDCVPEKQRSLTRSRRLQVGGAGPSLSCEPQQDLKGRYKNISNPRSK